MRKQKRICIALIIAAIAVVAAVLVLSAINRQQDTEPTDCMLSQEDKAQISDCLQSFTKAIIYAHNLPTDTKYRSYIISDALENTLGRDSYLDMYADLVVDNLYVFEQATMEIDSSTWSEKPLTKNGKELEDKGYRIVTVYGDYRLYSRIGDRAGVTMELAGGPRYLMTFTMENGKWLLVEQINVKARLEERQSAML